MNNFIIDFIADLHKSKSKKQIQSDAKNLGNIKVPLIGTLNKAKTKAQLKQDLASLNGTINLTGKVNQKGIVTSVQQATKQAQTTANKNTIQVSMNLKKDKLINDIKVFGQQNTKLFNDANMATKYNSLLDNAKLAASSKEIQNLRLQLSAMRSEIKATNLSGLTLGDTLKKAFKRATELFTGTGGVMLLIQQMRQAWTEALNLDKAYTDLIKVQDELSRGDYPNYLEQCNKKAQELAVTQQALIEGTTEFSKSGYTQTEANALTEKSTILANVGDMSASDSAKAIISGVQAYDIVDGYDDVIDKAGVLIDKYNEIGNTASITTAEIAEGVQSVGSVFADANTSVDEFIALLAAGNRQYQDADSLALGLRTAALRIRGCTTELEAMGEETDGVYTSASKLADKIEGLTNINGNGGVKILEADGETFRSIYDIFLDISKVYQQMSDTDKSALLELIAGKHRSSAISATLNNMSEAQEIYQRSLEASGSAQREYDKYLSSSEASLNRFRASMVETYQSVIDGQTVTGLLNCGNATLQFINSLGLVESTLKGLVAIGIVKAITTLSTAFKASAIQASNFGTALNTVKNMSVMAKGTTEYSNALKTLKAVSVSLSETQLKQVLASKALSESDHIAILRTTGLTKAQAQTKLAQMGLTQSTKAQTTANASATASTFSLTAAVKGFGASLKAAFMSNPVGIAIMTLSTVIGMVSSAIDSANQKAEEARQKAKDAADTASTLSNEISELTGKYLTLSNAVQTDRSSKEDLMTVQEELIKKLGIEGETIDSLIAKYGSLDEAIKQVTFDELGNMENDLVAGVKVAEDELKEIGKDYEHFYSLTNRNILSSSGKDAVRAYTVLNEAGIIDKGSYGTGGGSIVLTGDDSTVEGILENYQKLQDAMEALRESNEFTEEELKDNPVFLQIYNRAQEMKEFVDGYNDAFTDLNQNVAQQQMLSSLKGMELPDTEEEFNTFRDNLVKTAQSSNEFIGSQKDIEEAINGYLATVPQFAGYYGELSNAVENATEAMNQSTEDISANKESLEDIIRQYPELIKKATVGKLDEDVLASMDQYAELLSKVGLSADSSSSDVKKLVEQIQAVADNNLIDNLKAVSDDFESLGNAYNTLINKGEALSIDNLDSIQNVFGDLDMFDEWVRKVTDTNTSTEDLQQAFDDLATEYLNTSEISQSILDDLTTENAELIKLQLQRMGITNAEEIVEATLNGTLQSQAEIESILAQNKSIVTGETLTLTNVTAEEIQRLIAEGKITNETANQMAILAIKKQLVNGNTLNTSADINNLISLCQMLGATTTALERYNQIKNGANGMPSNVVDGYKKAAEKELQDAIKTGQASLNATYTSVPKAIYNGGANVAKALDDANKSAQSSAKEAEDTYEELFDFFERRIDVLNNALELLNANLENVIGSNGKNQLIDAQIGINKESINNYTDALAMYQSKASEALSKIPADFQDKIVNGAVALTDFIGSGNEDLVEAIKEYQKWADKVSDCQQELAKLKETIRQLELDKFNNIIEDFTNQFDISSNAQDLINKQIDLFKEAGQLIGKGFYEGLIKESEGQLGILQQEKESLVNELNSGLESGLIEKGTDEWLEMVDALDQVDGSILDCKKDIEEFNNSIQQLHWDIVERIQKNFDDLSDEINNLIGLIDDVDVSDAEGIWSNEGLTQLGLYAQEYEKAIYAVQMYEDEIYELNNAYLRGEYSTTEYADKLSELKDAQWDEIKTSESAKDAIMELNEARIEIMVDAIEKEIDAMKELIDSKKEALDAEEELYEYRQSITEKTKSVTDLERQIAAMENDNTASTVAKRKKLEDELSQAKQDLEDYEYKHSIDVQKDALDQQFEDFETEKNAEIEKLRATLDDMESVISVSFETVKNNAQTIGNEIAFIAQTHGAIVSESLITAWSSGDNAIASYGSTLEAGASSFLVNMGNMVQGVYGLQNQADITALSLANMYNTSSANLQNELINSYYSVANLNSVTQALNDSLINTLGRGYDVSSLVNNINSIGNAAASAAGKIRDMMAALNGAGKNDKTYTDVYQGNNSDNSNNLVRLPNGTITTRKKAEQDGYVSKYAKGGLVTKDDNNPLNNIAKSVGEDVLIAAKDGEMVLRPVEADALLKLAPNIELFNNLVPKLDHSDLMPYVPSIEKSTPSVQIHYDNLVQVQGDVNNSNIRQMEQIVDNAITKQFNQFNSNLRKAGVR